ncbi:MAG: caspase family protein, partial [Planctomycetaceae bacterium]|nr:caspase family protein [Planctomycetaceae bacterium]
MRFRVWCVLSALTVSVTLPADDSVAPAGSDSAGQVQLFESLAETAPSRNAGMFVGVCNFQHDPGLATLLYATHDAIELAHLFVFELNLIPATNCHLLLAGEPVDDVVTAHLQQLRRAGAKIGSADRSRILLTMREVQGTARESEDILVCGFSSHGFEDRADPYIMPSDGFRALLAQTAVPLKTIESMMQDSRAGHRLLLVDACQERISAKNVQAAGLGTPATDAFVEALKTPTGQAKLASCSPGEFSFEHGSLGGVGHGVFTHYVLEGLRGGAKADAKNIVRLGDVADY